MRILGGPDGPVNPYANEAYSYDSEGNVVYTYYETGDALVYDGDESYTDSSDGHEHGYTYTYETTTY